MSDELDRQYYDACHLLTRWRQVFAGQWLGTRPLDDPECQAVRYHAEKLLLMRVELTALIGLCMDKSIFSKAEFQQAVINECALMQADLENLFPGFTASPMGMDVDVKKAVETTKNWKP